MRHDIEFKAEDGTLLRGFLHSSGDTQAPGIVMAHGFSGVKEQIDHYAAAFAAGGFSVLCYDHRGFGASEGMPRLEVDAYRQLADWRDAISFMQTLPQVDRSAGIGVWGSSFAGGLAIVLGAVDSRVGCVVSQIPHVSGARNGRQMFNVAQRAQLLERLNADREARLKGAEPERIPVFTAVPETLAALLPPMSPRYIKASEGQTPSWSNEVTLRSVENAQWFEPASCIRSVSPTPFMMIVALNDTCTFPDLQLESFAEAREPKRLVTHRGGHFQTYTDHFTKTSEPALGWFREHLSLNLRR